MGVMDLRKKSVYLLSFDSGRLPGDILRFRGAMFPVFFFAVDSSYLLAFEHVLARV